jgi:hypothetical protein
VRLSCAGLLLLGGPAGLTPQGMSMKKLCIIRHKPETKATLLIKSNVPTSICVKCVENVMKV